MKNNQTISHPEYYLKNGKECIDYIDDYLGDQFSYGCIFKYLWRSGLKDDESLEKDQKKALWYFDHAVEHLYKDMIAKNPNMDCDCKTIVFSILKKMFLAAGLPEAIEFLYKNRMMEN